MIETRSEKPILTSLLWTDLYKITMGQAVFHNYPDLEAKYDFINRGKTKFPQGFDKKLRRQIEMMADLSLTTSDIDFLREKCPFLSDDYLNWFKDYHFNPDEVKITQEGGDLSVEMEGPWQRTIYWEVPLMATISQLYFEETGQRPDCEYLERAREKARRLLENGAKILEFGTRRAFSTSVHRNILEALIETAKPISEGGVLLGTSNVALAKEFNLNPSGTYAHEWVMGHAAMFGYSQANRKAMEVWADEYLGRNPDRPAYPRLGTALPDTFTSEVFLKDFDVEMAKYYSMIRQDSGNPLERGKLYVDHFRKICLDPMTHGILPSDGLDTDTTIFLNNYFRKITQIAFGIGTHLTNDVGAKPLNMVIKAFAFRLPNGLIVPVCKLSDNNGKESGEILAVKNCREELCLIA